MVVVSAGEDVAQVKNSIRVGNAGYEKRMIGGKVATALLLEGRA